MTWTLEQIEAQAERGGVNRQQAERLTGEVRRLRALLADVCVAAADALDGGSPDDLVDALDRVANEEADRG